MVRSVIPSCLLGIISGIAIMGVGDLKRWAGTALVVTFCAQAAMLPAHAAPSAPPSAANTPLDIVMLVDESGSLSSADVAREIQAAGTIAQTPLNPRSRVTVVGFGGVNGVAPNQDPTSVVCQPTVTSSAFNLDYLARCVRGLHRRTEAEGDDTDYAAALAQAMSYLSPDAVAGRQSPAGATKAIFLMTDGGLDVHRDPQYLPDWLTTAHHAVNLQLETAQAAGVQVWPLGFGSISPSDGAYLQHLAASGAQNACDTRTASRPRSVVVSNSADALDALYSLYTAAGCLGRSGGGSTRVSGGQTRTLAVNIPAIASAGAISVDKGNPAIHVDYIAPDGTTVTGGSQGGSTFQRSGQDTAVDVLHVSDPAPGSWKIRLIARPGTSSQLVSATAFWQGSVRASIIASPSSARVDQPIHVTLSVLGPHGPITDPATIRRIQVGVSVSGDGLSGPTSVPVSNAGEGSGTVTGVGDFHGTFTAPSTKGTLTFTGTAVGYGLHATQVPQQVQIGTQAALLQSDVQFSAPASVVAGHAVQGQILFRNQTGKSQRVLLRLITDHANATVAAPRGAIEVPSGSPPGTSFAVTIAGQSPPGTADIVVQVVSAANPQIRYGQGQLTVTVLSPPGRIGKYRWEILGVLLLIAAIVLAVSARRRAHRRAVDVRGLYAMLRGSNGDDVISELKAPNRWSDTFRFVIREEERRSPRLDTRKPGDAEHEARRDVRRSRRTGTVIVTTPEGEDYHVSIGSPGEPLPRGVRLAFREVARARTGRPPSQPKATGLGTGSGSGPPQATEHSAPATSPSEDIWQ
jgi:von Willebrand factor type A domain